MTKRHDSETQSDRLDGWKEIAAHLGKGVRSVQRWEAELGLPVRRIKTSAGQIVSASRREIDEWRTRLEIQYPGVGPPDSDGEHAALGPEKPAAVEPGAVATPARGTRWPAWRWLPIVVVCVAAGWAWRSWWFRSPSDPPAVMVLAGSKLEARDSFNRLLWAWSFGTDVSRPMGRNMALPDDRIAKVDLNDDGVVENLVPVRFSPPQDQSASTDALFAFSSSGRPLWSVKPETKLHCAGETFQGPWRLYAVQVSSAPGPKHIWMAFVHHTSWPSFIVDVAPDGTSTLRYLQTGWIVSLAEWKTPAGLRLAAGGVVHDFDQPSVVILDPTGPPVMSPHTDPRFACDGAPTALPLQMTLFPNFDVAQAAGAPYLMADTLKVVGPDLEAELGPTDAVAFIGPNRVALGLTFADTYWSRHRTLESLGKLSHPALRCPEATRPQVIRTWTAQYGWEEQSMTATNGPRR